MSRRDDIIARRAAARAAARVFSGAAMGIPLTGGFVAIIDAQDADAALAHSWYADVRSNTVYAARNTPRPNHRVQHLHTFLAGYDLTDHVNGNGLDNRRVNLRRADGVSNSANRRKSTGTSSQYKGVGRHGRRWRAYIKVDRRFRFLGSYDDPLLAATTYDIAAREVFGAFAAVNFPQPGERSALTGELR